METLKSTEPHYIRCIKPNSLNSPQKFENQSVLHQLRCGVSIYSFKKKYIYISQRLNFFGYETIKITITNPSLLMY